MNVTSEDAKELTSALRDFLNKSSDLGGLSGLTNSGVSTVNINAGGVGIWIATTCCIAMLVSMVVGCLLGCFWLQSEFQHKAQIDADQSQKISTMYDYLSAIYAQAPQLKPKEDKK
jgi:hypothetical protein